MYSTGSTQSSQDYTSSYYAAPFANYIITNCDTPNSAYSPVPNSGPNALIATPNNNGYATYMTPTNSNSPANIANATASTSVIDYSMTPMHSYTNLMAYSTPYSLITIPQHSPIPAYTIETNTPPSSNNSSQASNMSYLQDINNISNISNCQNNSYINKENQRSNRGYRNNNNNSNKRNLKWGNNNNNNNNSMTNNQNINGNKHVNANSKRMNCNNFTRSKVQNQENQPRVYSPNYQENNNRYYHDSSRTQSSTSARVEDSYVQNNFCRMPCNDIANYQQSPVGYCMSSSEYYQRDHSTCVDTTTSIGDEYQDMMQKNDSYEDEKLACKICRGKKKCFCYFLKVGYKNFPSFNDYCEHQAKQSKTNMFKTTSRRM